MSVTYTGTVTSTGEGRNGGRLRSDDGLVDIGLAIPKELGGAGGATNPEQLFAAAWSGCFMGAVRLAAGAEKVRLESIAVEAQVTLHHDDDEKGFYLTGRLEVTAGGVDQATIQRLADIAHTTCPYSKAISGNVPVEVVAHAL